MERAEVPDRAGASARRDHWVVRELVVALAANRTK
jgi:hypothetical protein